MVVCSEIDSGEGNITQEACRCALVKSNQAQLTNDMNSAARNSTFNLGSLTCYLQADFAMYCLNELADENAI